MKKVLCVDCPALIWSCSKRCKSCAAKAKYRDPAAREKMRQAKLRSLAERPEQLAALRVAGAAQLRVLHAARREQGYPTRIAAPIPAERRKEYTRLRRRFGPDEAARIILDDEAAQARRAIRKSEQQMREREERRQREAY